MTLPLGVVLRCFFNQSSGIVVGISKIRDRYLSGMSGITLSWVLDGSTREERGKMVHLLLLLLLLLHVLDGATTRTPTPIRRIGIVGSGPGGLSLAAALQRQQSNIVDEITIFEKRGSHLQAELGGGVQLSGGAVVLSKLGGLERLQSVAQPVQNILSRNSRGDVLLDINVSDLLKARAPSLIATDGTPVFFSIMRDALQQLLWELAQPTAVGSKTKLTVLSDRQVVATEELPSGGVVVVCSDGQRHEFDLVVGADGAKSVVRDAVLKSCSSLDISAHTTTETSAASLRDTGIEIIYGVTCEDDDFSFRPGGKGCFHQWFGDSAYALSASYGSRGGHVQHMVGLVLRSSQSSESSESSDALTGTTENIDWESTATIAATAAKQFKTVVSRQEVQALLVSAGLSVPSTGLSDMVNACQRFIRLKVKDRSAPLLRWSSPRGGLVVLGDAAHPMAPFLGQGANQAIQDSFVLARTIERVNLALSNRGQGGPGWMRTLSALQINPMPLALLVEYQRPRFLSTTLLSLKSNFLGQVETLGGPIGQFSRDSFFRLAAALGVAQLVLLSGAVPSLD